jgi:trimeric autotransporter adhesin
VINLSGLVSSRSPTSPRDPFSVYLTVPGANQPNNQTPVVNLPVDVGIVNANPAGIVDGFYSALTAGTAVTQVVIPQGSTSSSNVYVGTPTMAGTYQVQASAPGMAARTSALLTVFAPELKFLQSTVVVGKGLRSYVAEGYVSRNINGAAFAGTDAVTVSLACSSTAICSVPTSVIIPTNSSSVYFPLDGYDYGNTTITASAVGYNSPSQDLGVSVIMPKLNFSGPANAVVGGKSNFSVYLTVPGANQPNNQTPLSVISIDVTNSVPGVATIPITVTIPVGSTASNTAQLTGVAAGNTTLTASGSGLQSATSAVVTISP